MSGEKTEQPTDKKLRDAKKKGQVAVSKDAQVLAKLIFFYMIFFWLCDGYAKDFQELIEIIVKVGFTQHFEFNEDVFVFVIRLFFKLALPLIGVCIVSSTLITWAQTGIVVAPEALMPSFKKFNAVENVKNMFSKKSLVQLLLSVVKAFILALVGFLVVKSSLSNLVFSYRIGLTEFFSLLKLVLQRVVFISLGVFVILALIDWAVVYMQHIKSLKMSHSDIKDENKQTQGNPETKRRHRSEHRNILNSSLNRVSSAKVVVANPTHISVALDYEPGVHDLPYILAMGEDSDALAIRREAKKHGIPVIEHVKLARSLYQDCEEEHYIQKDHLVMAAEVFKAVFQLNK